MKAKRYGVLLLVVLLAVLLVVDSAAAQSGGPDQPLVHIVQRGETLFSIAQHYGTTVDALTHANGIPDPRNIYVGQRLTIANGSVPPALWMVHFVRPGETLAAVATQYGVNWETMAQANRLLNPQLLSSGQVLQVPVDEEPTGGGLHAVQPGETLLGIAFRYQVSLQELMAANGIADAALLLPGQWLLIPGQRPAWMPLPFEEIDLTPLPVQQGETLWVMVRTVEPVTLSGQLFDRSLQFVEENGAYYALVGVHALTDPGLYELTLSVANGGGEQAAVSIGVPVGDGGYSYERIDVPPSRTNLLDPELVVAEQQRLAQVQTIFTSQRRWDGPFWRPVEAAISSYYGTRRSYSGGPYNSFHAGLDFNAGGGTAVLAPADGTVVLAEPLAVRGNAVIVDHGWGLMTGYWHLAEIGVAVGQEVRRGDVLGRVGNTGLSTGAHLHWEFIVNGVSVDGLQWLDSAYPWTDLQVVAVP